MGDFLTAVGLMLIFEGIPYFIAPDRMRRWVLSMMALPDQTLRRHAIVVMSLGLGLIWWVRHS